jgi:glycosyltransferase involved in cell wall biosynthesis
VSISRAFSASGVSVVMCVYNGLPELSSTLESILCQDGVDIEVVVVDDGSTDNTFPLLRKYANSDRRLRIFKQKHQGVTDALITGCAQANGKYIARQDARDVSLPDRFRKQVDRFFSNSDLALVSCETRFFGPVGEFLYETQESSNEADAALRSPDLAVLRGPSHHGCTMFRRDHYFRAGGYRWQFKVAQDLDLWTRLVAFGRHDVIPEILYESTLTPNSISGVKRLQQVATKKHIAECMRSRMTLGDDSKLLEHAVHISTNNSLGNTRKTDADFYYFLASCLRRMDPLRSRHYLMAALRKNPLHWKALIRAVQSQLGAR